MSITVFHRIHSEIGMACVAATVKTEVKFLKAAVSNWIKLILTVFQYPAPPSTIQSI